MNILQRILQRKPKPEHVVIGTMIQNQEIQNAYIIALARLLFIKPETLDREAKNFKSNAEYLLKLIEAQKGEKHGN